VRRSSLLLLVSLGWTLSACAWQAKTAAPETAVRPAAEITGTPGAKLASNDPGDPNQIICKREEVTGSRLEGAKECHSRAEWAQIKATGYDKLQMLGAPGPTPTQTAAQAGN
jgi:cytochrome c5